MMRFYIMTLFPEMVMGGLNTSIIGRAKGKGLLSIEAVNIRDYAFNKHNSVDDYPYGGGAGMLMQAEPVYQAYEAVREKIRGIEECKRPEGRKASSQGFVSSICRHREEPLTRKWQRSFPQKRNLSFSVDTMKGLMSVCWRKL